MANDPDVQLLRIRNGFAPDWDAKTSVGFRMLVLSLRLIGGTARRLGVDRHIVELQLRIASLHRLYGPQQHAHYVAFKDIMAGGN